MSPVAVFCPPLNMTNTAPKIAALTYPAGIINIHHPPAYADQYSTSTSIYCDTTLILKFAYGLYIATAYPAGDGVAHFMEEGSYEAEGVHEECVVEEDNDDDVD